MAHRQYFRHKHMVNKITGTGQTLLEPKPRPGEEYHYQRITMRNETSGGSDLLIGEKSGSAFVLLDIIEELPVDTLGVNSASEIVIQDNERLELQIRDATASDVITVIASGYIWPRSVAGI